YFFADLGGNFIRVFDPANPGTFSANLAATADTSTAFASGLSGSSPVDLKVDAAGNLYYLARSPGSIWRISTAKVVGAFLAYEGSAFDTAVNNDPALAPDK